MGRKHISYADLDDWEDPVLQPCAVSTCHQVIKKPKVMCPDHWTCVSEELQGQIAAVVLDPTQKVALMGLVSKACDRIKSVELNRNAPSRSG